MLMTLSRGGWIPCPNALGRRGTCGLMVLFIIIKKVINNVDDFKSGRLDSNQRPPGPKPGILTGLNYAPNGYNI